MSLSNATAIEAEVEEELKPVIDQIHFASQTTIKTGITVQEVAPGEFVVGISIGLASAAMPMSREELNDLLDRIEAMPGLQRKAA